MKKWGDSSLSAILEYPFDFDQYIEEGLRQISDLDERKFAKKLLLDGLGKMIQCTEEKYQNLQKRVYEELEMEANQYEVVMTIVEKKDYDPTNETLFPVDEGDLEGKKQTEKYSDEQNIYLGTIFLEASETIQKEFEEKGRFSGTLLEKEVKFSVKKAKRYEEDIEELYQIFQDNGIPWETVNTGYLDKFYDIYVDRNKISETDGMLSLEDTHILFESFTPMIKSNILPLWNIEKYSFDSSDFMLPCTDGIYYEHELLLDEERSLDGYLVQSNSDILEIRHEKKKIIIKSREESFENWKVFHFVQKETICSFHYHAPLLTNHRKDSFLRRYAAKKVTNLMTKTELFRKIMEFDIQEFIEIIDYKIVEEDKTYPIVRGMNFFLQDTLFPIKGRKVLVLIFHEKQPGNYLTGSMIRFVVSQIQMEIGEYRCVGVLK